MVVGYNDRFVKVIDLKAENVIATYKPQRNVEEFTTDIDAHSDNTNFVAGFTDGVVLVGSSWSSKVCNYTFLEQILSPLEKISEKTRNVLVLTFFRRDINQNCWYTRT